MRFPVFPQAVLKFLLISHWKLLGELAYRGHAGLNLQRYALRWQTEKLHSALKTRGFNLEDTGLTRAERVSILSTVVRVVLP